MVIAFGSKESHDALMQGKTKLEYTPGDIEELKGVAGADEVVVAYRDVDGKLKLEPTEITLAEWVDRFGSLESLHDGSWGDEL